MIGKKRYDDVQAVIERYNQFLQTKLFREDVLEKCLKEFMEICKPAIQRSAAKDFLTRLQKIAKQSKKAKK